MIFEFIIMGKPKVQKNDIVLLKMGNRHVVGHSSKLKSVRDEITNSLYRQYVRQGRREPIEFLVNITMTFYVTKASEPDLDNLPSIVLDAIQGISIGKLKKRVGAVLSNDKLVRKLTTEKIVKGDESYVGEPRTEIRIEPYVRRTEVSHS